MRPWTIAVLLGTSSLLALGCGSSSDFESGRSTDGVTKSAADAKGEVGGGDADVESGDGDGADAGTDDSSDGGQGSDDLGADDGMTGAEVFAARVQPVFQAQCVSCHADPRIPVDTRGPLSVYSYDKMLSLLADGSGSVSNALLDKVRNISAHTGGNRCVAGVTASPCDVIVAWWTAEYGEDDAGAGVSGSVGKISQVAALGRVYGWAVDPGDATAQLTVTFYVDGEMGLGTEVGTTVANRSGVDGNTAGDHAFFFDLPETVRDGKARQLYAYVKVEGVDKLIGERSFGFTAYAFSAAGRSYYEANVKGRLSGCAGCHTVSYEQQFYSMIAPSPSEGGTATNNQLLNKAAQANGTSHGGGQRCSSVSASPCAEIQQWWRTEFGG